MAHAHEIIRAWKDPDLRAAASAAHPAGEIDLTEAVGGVEEEIRTEYLYTTGCCGGLTTRLCWPTVWVGVPPQNICQYIPH